MSKACSKIKCPNRFSIGKQSDKDVINLICPKCEQLYYKSEDRRKSILKKLKYSLLSITFLSISLLIWLKTDLISNTKPEHITKNSPENTLNQFFNNINNKDYESAYKLTNHKKWSSLTKFKEFLKYWKFYDIKTFEGKTYYSRYEADTIINVKYNAIEDESLIIDDREYDFHLKKYNNEWKIVRLYFPKNPNIDFLKTEEVPKTAKGAVELFLKLLNNKLYQKAFLISNNPKWGNKKKFTSSKGFGCITNIAVYELKKIETVNPNLEIIYARYYAKDPCNKSNNHEFYFYVSNQDDYWKIINAKTKY
ncbi:hypothetical protein [Pontimicrobium sp. MEBiC01747]